jgi:hypothetical protein
MKRKVFEVVAGSILGASMMVVPSQAATVKNGVACSKANATTKVGSKVYRCGKNPYVKPTQLTWTLRGCFTANALLKDARSQYEDWKDLAKLAGADGEKTLMELQTSITELENTMKNEVCKRGA